MDKQEDVKKLLKIAYKETKEPKMLKTILAVHMVRMCDKSHQETATNLMRPARWVAKCVEVYNRKGLDGLQEISNE